MAYLAHVSEVLQSQGLWDAATPLQGIPSHDRTPFHVVHHQQHLVASGVIYHFLHTARRY